MKKQVKLYLDEVQAEWIRTQAFERRCTNSQIVAEVLAAAMRVPSSVMEQKKSTKQEATKNPLAGIRLR